MLENDIGEHSGSFDEYYLPRKIEMPRIPRSFAPYELTAESDGEPGHVLPFVVLLALVSFVALASFMTQVIPEQIFLAPYLVKASMTASMIQGVLSMSLIPFSLYRWVMGCLQTQEMFSPLFYRAMTINLVAVLINFGVLGVLAFGGVPQPY